MNNSLCVVKERIFMALVGTHCLASPLLQVKQQHSKVALQANRSVSHLIFLLLSLAKPSSCVNLTRQNEVITNREDLESCIIYKVQCPWYTFNTLKSQKEEKKKNRLTREGCCFSTFCRLRTRSETLYRWLNWALRDNCLHHPQMEWEHLHRNHEKWTDDLLAVAGEEGASLQTPV